MIRLRLLRPSAILLQERKNLAIFLTLLWVLHFIFVQFFDGRERVLKRFVIFFLCAARFLFCFL